MAQETKPPTSPTTPPAAGGDDQTGTPPAEPTTEATANQEAQLKEAKEYIEALEKSENNQKAEIAKLTESVKSLKAELKQAKQENQSESEFDLLGWIEAQDLQQQSISANEPLPEWINMQAGEDQALFIRKVDLTTATGFAPDTFENQGKQIGEFAKTKFAEGLTVKHQFRPEGKVPASERPATIITIMLVKGY